MQITWEYIAGFFDGEGYDAYRKKWRAKKAASAA